MPSALLNPRLLKTAIAAALLSLSAMTAQTNDDFNRGVVEFHAGNYTSAVESFAKAEAASPGTTDALLYQSKSLIHLDNFTGAEKTVRQYLATHPQSSDAAYLLGFILHRENRPSDSLAAYTQAAALTTPTADDLKIVALNYVLLDDYADAIKWLQKAVEFDPTNKDAWYYLGRAYYTRSRLIEARDAFVKVLKIDPEDSKAENSLGLVLESDAQPDAALDAYRKAIQWDERSAHPSEQPYVNLGSLLMEQGHTQEAIPFLDKSVVLSPDNAFCRLKLGTVYMRAGDLHAAQKELEKATALDPDNSIAHYQLGRLYKAMHDLNRAQAEFDRTAELQNRSSRPQADRPQH